MNQTTIPNVAMSDFHDGLDPASPERLAGVDLNLLVAFDALARERSVTRAAARSLAPVAPVAGRRGTSVA